MITLTQLLDLVCTSDALIIGQIVQNILHRDDVGHFKVGWENLWVPREGSLRREAAMELGWGCQYLAMMDDAVDETEGGEWTKANADQRRDLMDQKIMMAQIIHAYLFILHEDGQRASWLARDAAWGEELEVKIDDAGELVEVWVVKAKGRKVKVDIGERIVL